jgi:hypothetical protein
MSSLRWVVKDDRGCSNPVATNYNSLATINDGSCLTTSIGRDALLENKNTAVGRISLDNAGLNVSIGAPGAHMVRIVKL